MEIGELNWRLDSLSENCPLPCKLEVKRQTTAPARLGCNTKGQAQVLHVTMDSPLNLDIIIVGAGLSGSTSTPPLP